MATYFHQNSDIQAPDGLQTLVLMNPSYVQYSADAPPGGSGNFVFLNSAAAATASTSHLAHMPQPSQQLVGIPLPTSATTTTASQDHRSTVHVQHEISPLHGLIPRLQYNLWNPVDPSAAARETPRPSHSQQGGLSLSLSSQQPPGFRSFRNEREPPQPAASGGGGGGSPSSASASGVTNNGGGVPGFQGMLLSSKYLKAAQELLDEVVNVGGGMNKADTSKKASSSGQSKATGGSSSSAVAAAGKEDGSGKSNMAELSTAERQEIQMKKAKLINMLDEVEQRYRQYHNQMRIVISSFEQVAGIGSAKTYTALALQTISKQFRCLKDAIACQIKAANKSLGEEDSPGCKIEGSRLKFVDHQIRQQRALQQLGMIQHNAWRPQRGLPERSVSILRAWLFEHFLHPYPKDSDKHMLAKQTGLTRSQVSNWFINARVRLWKPMVEEMYVEEMKEQENNGMDERTTSKSIGPNEDSALKSSSPQDKGHSSENMSSKSFKSKETNSMTQDAQAISTNSASSIGESLRAPPGFTLIGSSELEGIAQVSPKKPRSTEMLHSPTNVSSLEDQVTLKFGDERAQSRDGYSIMGAPANFIGGFGQYPMGEIGRFGAEQFVPSPTFTGNGVSLTLGLPHTENLSLSIDHHQAFLPSQSIHLGRRVEVGEGNEFGAINSSIPPPHSSTAYESINIQNRKRFAAQLLPDFVA
ncbi:BEL1-like homeodomain protein 1 [Punica granatum]|uniref:BEL1-like homeodomain protein 1 n=1 Tax=Punica granatum TaxID=22663 RepID=A0A218XBI8_PUNGR|nr:BEL1-like homeodomain protein 1 [Punica granatum]XP_031399259.1 BEL1-like homeodomain protein 1 [Punica granatum]XP_031399260.1 BEL1-like homeodomain protein 1 [Punica granatum]OWM82585.1 hypothetical protein CDL15_Pgr002160 [Punica granatum]